MLPGHEGADVGDWNSPDLARIATDAKGIARTCHVGAERTLCHVAADVVSKITPAHISDEGRGTFERSRRQAAS
jgi:hypothetical protein